MNNIIKYADNFDGTSCNFSYLSPNILGGSFAENFSIVGRGKIVLLKLTQKSLIPFKEFYFDKAINTFIFNRINNYVIYAGDIEGKLIFINYSDNNELSKKDNIMSNKIHFGDITSLNTGKIAKHLLITTSMDNSSKIIDINKNITISNIQNFSKKGFTSSSFDYKSPNIISLNTNDGFSLFFDIRNNSKPIKCFIFNNPILTSDFNHFDSTFVVGESNGIINLYDLRRDSNSPLNTLTGHQLAVKEIKFSPLNKNILCSCGYDMNIHLWNSQYSLPFKTFKHHTEFVTGIDFSSFEPNVISSISFDKTLDIIKF